ncbi:hypothetical protein [Actinocrispum wychmicini]|uniref:Uncharacterized protein n=1 Tax=Actinocrispum wychmicini TaxID=1213861 RepID=A0A4R2ISY3_9PSEU|nr:hypothetical protein [Actinocrispum wychmicini]TCO47319.1 hypothetical protein EV192_11759 [Actinocrispum wychmicini]
MTAPEPFKMLCSYAYFRVKRMDEFLGSLPGGEASMLFGDSGAHSARTLGIHLTLEDYAAWCRRWDDQLTVYSNLDVIGAPEATYRNQKRLEAMGLQPLPVFHTGEPWYWLERYLDEGYTYIALGKLLGNPVKVVTPWLVKAFRLAEGRAVFHGFGMTVWELLKTFPFYSVDSSTWGRGFRWGTIRLFDRGRWVLVRLRDRAAVLRHRDLIRKHGYDPVILAHHDTYDRAAMGGLCAVAYHRAEAWLRARHHPVGVPSGVHNPFRCDPAGVPAGLHLYLADATTHWLLRAATGVHRYDHPPTTRE